MSCSDFIGFCYFVAFDLSKKVVVSVTLSDLLGQLYELLKFLFFAFLVVLFELNGEVEGVDGAHQLTCF